MVRENVNAVQLFQALYQRKLTEEQILEKLIEAKKSPGKELQVDDYRFRYSEETGKYEDNQIQSYISRVLQGESPKDVIRRS